jgi:hypothetical protein
MGGGGTDGHQDMCLEEGVKYQQRARGYMVGPSLSFQNLATYSIRSQCQCNVRKNGIPAYAMLVMTSRRSVRDAVMGMYA